MKLESYGLEEAAESDPLLQVYLLGLVDFDAALALQRRLVYEVAGRRSSVAMLLCEHPPLLTIGRQGSWRHIQCGPAELKARGWRTRWVNRGSGCLLHQPGQLAIYPILALDSFQLNVPSYLERLQQALLDLLADFKIRGQKQPGQSGIWVGPRQIADIGVAVRFGVTYFGAVLNLNLDLAAGHSIRVTGTAGARVTSIERERHGPLRPALVRERFLEHFCACFSLTRTALFFDHPFLTRKAPLDALATSS